jgi:hypothetical protein
MGGDGVFPFTWTLVRESGARSGEGGRCIGRRISRSTVKITGCLAGGRDNTPLRNWLRSLIAQKMLLSLVVVGQAAAAVRGRPALLAAVVARLAAGKDRSVRVFLWSQLMCVLQAYNRRIVVQQNTGKGLSNVICSRRQSRATRNMAVHPSSGAYHMAVPPPRFPPPALKIIT